MLRCHSQEVPRIFRHGIPLRAAAELRVARGLGAVAGRHGPRGPGELGLEDGGHVTGMTVPDWSGPGCEDHKNPELSCRCTHSSDPQARQLTAFSL